MKKNNRQVLKDKKLNELLLISSRVIKTKGFRATSIDEVMAKGKLTRGSFYAYFKSKDDMILKSLAWMVDQSHEKIKTQLVKIEEPGEIKFSAFIDFYLSPNHREQVGEGCPIAALSRDISLSPLRFRQEFANLLSATIDNRRALASSKTHMVTRKRWMSLMSTYVGALILSRACAGTDLSNEILNVAHDYLVERKGK